MDTATFFLDDSRMYFVIQRIASIVEEAAVRRCPSFNPSARLANELRC